MAAGESGRMEGRARAAAQVEDGRESDAPIARGRRLRLSRASGEPQGMAIRGAPTPVSERREARPGGGDDSSSTTSSGQVRQGWVGMTGLPGSVPQQAFVPPHL
jgi:hypothetical protein